MLSAVASPDPRVRVVLGTRLVTIGAAPITLLLVITRLAPAEQGLYFIFLNVLAFAQLFEIGIGSLIVQYASHEAVHVSWGAHGSIAANEPALVRIGWMLRRSVRWYCAAAVAILLLAVPLGIALFSVSVGPQRIPTARLWLSTVVLTAAYLPLVPVLNTIEGCGRLIEVQRMRFVQAVVMAISAWVLIPTVGGLYAVTLNAMLQLVVAGLWLSRRFPAMIVFAWRASTRHTAAASTTELDRLYATQLRTAAVWLSAHVAAQGLTPLVLYFHGAAYAGQVGATLAITTVPYTIGMSWLQGRLPDFGALAAQERHAELDAAARAATLQAAAVCLVGAIGVVVAIEALHRFVPALSNRFLPIWPAAALAGAALVGLLLQAMASYIRAYRAEPLVVVLVVGYGAMLGAAWLAATRWGPGGAVIAYSIVGGAVALPATALMLRHERLKLVVARSQRRFESP